MQAIHIVIIALAVITILLALAYRSYNRVKHTTERVYKELEKLKEKENKDKK